MPSLLLVSIPLLCSFVAWRWLPLDALPWAIAASLLAIAIAAAVGARAERRRLPVVAAALAVAIVALKFVPGAWPCDACRETRYASLAGWPVWQPALLAYAVVAALTAAALRIPSLRGPARIAAFALLGCSLYFVAVAIAIGFTCGHCFATHTAVAVLAACSLRPWRLAPWHAFAGTAAFLALHLAYHPPGSDGGGSDFRPRPESSAAEGGAEEPGGEGRDEAIALSASELAILLDADRRRRLGPPDAPFRIELLLDPTCPHCRELYASFRTDPGWRTAIAGGRVQIVVRLRFAEDIQASVDTARWCLAASTRGRFDAFLDALLGIPSHLSSEERLERIALQAGFDVAPIAAFADEHRAALDRLLAIDRARMRELTRRRASPVLHVSGPGFGPRGRLFVVKIPLAEILERLKAEG